MKSESLSQDDDDHYSVVVKVMHDKSALKSNSFLFVMKKDSKSNRTMTDSYIEYWKASDDKNDDNDAEETRTTQYMSLVNK